MAQRVTGLPLEEALSALEDTGVTVASIEKVAVPADFSGRKHLVGALVDYVAAVIEREDGSVLLRVVSVPAEPLSEIHPRP